MGEPAGTELVGLDITHNPLAQVQHGDGGTDTREADESVASVHGTDGVANRSLGARPARISAMYVMNADKYKALLSKVTKRSSKKAMLMSVQGVVFAFTFMMSTFETSNRTMIIIVMTSFAGTVGLAAHLRFGEVGLACYVAFLLGAGGLVYHAVRRLEAVEVFKEKYEAAYRECTKGIEPGSDQLGPRPLPYPDLMQDGDHDVDFYIEEATRLFEPFEEVLAVLAKAADPTGETVTVFSNTKGREVSGGPGSRRKHGVVACACDYAAS